MSAELLECDVLVAGGGLAGVCAAIAAARAGMNVILAQDRPVLGGNSSSEVRVWVCGATATGHQRFARETGIMGELYLENEYVNPLGSPVLWDLVVLNAVKAEPNTRLLLNTHVRDVHVHDGRIAAVEAYVLGSERDLRIEARYVIDCTGDGSVGARAGAEFMLGRESRELFGEKWAPELDDDITLGSTILFYTKEESEPVPFVAPEFAIDVTQTSILESRILRTGDQGADYWWIEWGGELDIVADNERIRDELWAVIYGIWDYIKNSGRFDADNLSLEWVGAVPGKREYRRLLGDTVMTQSDIETDRRKPDAIGFGGWSIDLHPPKGVYEPRGAAQQVYPAGIYDIPFGALYSRTIPNLLMAGRNISASHVAFGSLRVMATCAVMGEAAGTAAALCIERSEDPRHLAQEVGVLQQRLLRNDASLVGVPWQDQADLAPTALITASSSFDGAATPELVGAVALDADTAVVFPVTHETSFVMVALSAEEDVLARYSIHDTEGPLVFTPGDVLASGSVALERGGPNWQKISLPSLAAERNLALVFHADPKVSWAVATGYLFGQLAMRRRGGTQQDEIDAHVEPTADNDVVRWEIKAFSRTRLALTVPNSSAYSPQRVISSYTRPYGGPQLWISEPLGDRPEWLELHWDHSVDIETVSLIFNDDVNQYVNNLHYKRWPFRIVPEIVAAYDIQVLRDDVWETVIETTENRQRHRRHAVDRDGVTALRIQVHATNGAECAQIVGVRVF